MKTPNLSRDQYIVVATAFLSLFSVIGIMFYGMPFYFDFWVKDFNWSRATVTSGNIIGKIIAAPFLGFSAGWLIDRFGPRKLMIFGVLISGMAVMAFSTLRSRPQFYFIYFFVAAGFTFGGPLPNHVLISRWFRESRGKAMGIAYLGIGIGGMFVPQLAKYLNAQFHWRMSLFVLGIIMIAFALPMVWLVRDEPPNYPQNEIQGNTPVYFSKILSRKEFYFLAIGSMCSIAAVTGISQNLKLFLSLDLKFSQQLAANLISMILGASIIGRLLMGYLADRYSKKSVMILIYSLISISILLLYYASSPFIIYLFAIVFGIGVGGDYMIIPLMAAELFGIKYMGKVMGLIIAVDGFGEALGPVLAGALRDKYGNYLTGFTALIILSLIGTMAIFLLKKKYDEAGV